MSNFLEEFYSKYPIYKKVKYSFDNCQKGEFLHPLFVMTQRIIDGFIENGSKRIAVVLPDDDCNIMPLVISKYFSNVQNGVDYAGSVLDDITPGQHLMLGRAVVEFVEIDREKNTIKFKVGRKDVVIVTCPINGIHYMFEKTERALSTYKTWYAEREAAEIKLEHSNQLINTLKAKRTVLKKTLVILSGKNDFSESAESLFINGTKFSDVVSYGEVDLSENDGFKLYNKGRLDCIPGITVTARIDELKSLVKNEKYLKEVATIFVDNNKLDEIIENQDTLTYILKKGIPVIVFVPESKFEMCPPLNGLGFDFWHWKPSTIKMIPKLEESVENSVFGHLTSKVNHAISSEFSSVVVNQPLLRQTLYSISRLSQITVNFDFSDRQLVRRLWAFQNKLSSLLCRVIDSVAEKLSDELFALKNAWEERRELYLGQEIESLINSVLNNFTDFIAIDKPMKLSNLEDLLLQPQNINRNVTVVVPNEYAFFAETYKALSSIDFGGSVRLLKLKSFYENMGRNHEETDLLVVIWFDKDEYIRIKQTYCYNKLTYLLYVFENNWRNRFVNRFDECLPHESVKASAVKINIPVENIGEKPFDKAVEVTDEKEFDEISDYNISHKIIRSTIVGEKKYTTDMPDTVFCVPVIFEGNRVGYFYPEHDLINVSGLIKGDINRPVKKPASSLKKGDNILIRQSGRDIIREKADWLMESAGENEVRKLSELWRKLLQWYATDKSIWDVCRLLNAENADCTLQQVRYWLSGETIMPRDKNVIIAIAKCASKENFLANTDISLIELVDFIFDAGKKVQAYHQKAGKLLTSELKNKAEDIKTLFNSDVPYGTIEGIGEVYIYTVEDVLDKELIERGKLNRIEDL